LGLSGRSNDMRSVLEAAGRGDDRASLAVEVFCYVLAKALAGLVVPLGRPDALVFTGGIGENSRPLRARGGEPPSFLGLAPAPAANASHGRAQGGRITLGTTPQALVVPTNEELMIALDTAEIVAQGAPAFPP